jgi:hypothetical protein
MDWFDLAEGRNRLRSFVNTHIFTGILIVKELTARRLYKSFDVKGLTLSLTTRSLSTRLTLS